MNLIEAAKEVVSRWDTPSWKDVPATAEYINRLRAAIEAAEAIPKIPKNELPERIYLQISDDPDDEWYGEIVWREVTWSHDKIHSNDLVFIRQDLIPAAPAVPEGWQPIETAPKDGRYVMLGNPQGQWIGRFLAVFQSGFKPDNPWQSMMLNHDHMPRNKSCEPTHWMPLPTAPKFGEKE